MILLSSRVAKRDQNSQLLLLFLCHCVVPWDPSLAWKKRFAVLKVHDFGPFPQSMLALLLNIKETYVQPVTAIFSWNLNANVFLTSKQSLFRTLLVFIMHYPAAHQYFYSLKCIKALVHPAHERVITPDIMASLLAFDCHHGVVIGCSRKHCSPNGWNKYLHINT